MEKFDICDINEGRRKSSFKKTFAYFKMWSCLLTSILLLLLTIIIMCIYYFTSNLTDQGDIQDLFSSTVFETILLSAILITGGKVGPYLRSAEIYLPSDNSSCTLLPALPYGRAWHTQDGPWACGGIGTEKSCDKWSQESWTRSHNLSVRRDYHVSWATASGVYLMGGIYSESSNTSELVKEDGSVSEGFKLEYNTV